MRSKLFIHIGYPKTATTTLQDGLFIKLHQAGLINYLGRSLYSKISQFKQANILSRSLFQENKLKKNDLQLSSESPNLISEETLTFPTFYKEKQFKKDLKNSCDFAFELKDKLKKFTTDIQVIVTLRSHVDLIYSLYSTKYGLFSKDHQNANAKNHIFNKNNSVKTDLFSIYNFYQLVKSYKDAFGEKNVKILFFEDFKYDKELFLDELSEYLSIEKSIIQSNFDNVHYRNADKTDMGTLVHFREKRLLGKAIKKFEKIIFYKNRFNGLEDMYESNKLVLKIKRRFTLNKTHLIPKLTNDQKKIIFNEFKDSNLKLSKEFGIDGKKLKKYNYI